MKTMCRIDNAKLWDEKWGGSAIMVRKRKSRLRERSRQQKSPAAGIGRGAGVDLSYNQYVKIVELVN